GRLGAACRTPPILPMKLDEEAIQRAVFEHLAVRGVPRLFAFHPANGGYRRPVEAARLKGLGCVLACHTWSPFTAARSSPSNSSVRSAGQPTLNSRPSRTSAPPAAMLRFAMASIVLSPCWKRWGLLRGRAGKRGTDRSKRHADR